MREWDFLSCEFGTGKVVAMEQDVCHSNSHDECSTLRSFKHSSWVRTIIVQFSVLAAQRRVHRIDTPLSSTTSRLYGQGSFQDLIGLHHVLFPSTFSRFRYPGSDMIGVAVGHAFNTRNSVTRVKNYIYGSTATTYT